MAKTRTPAPRRAGNTNEKRARLVRMMLEIAALNREEYRRLRSEMWQAAARSHDRKPDEKLREWSARAS